MFDRNAAKLCDLLGSRLPDTVHCIVRWAVRGRTRPYVALCDRMWPYVAGVHNRFGKPCSSEGTSSGTSPYVSLRPRTSTTEVCEIAISRMRCSRWRPVPKRLKVTWPRCLTPATKSQVTEKYGQRRPRAGARSWYTATTQNAVVVASVVVLVVAAVVGIEIVQGSRQKCK